MPTTSPGSAEIRRAAVACTASDITPTTSSTFISAANAPKSWGPSTRAVTIWKTYVATFITPMATAIAAPLSRARGRACVDSVTEPG